MQTICGMAASRHVFNRCGLGVVFTACLGACICSRQCLASRRLVQDARTLIHLSSSPPTVAQASLRVLTRYKKTGLGLQACGVLNVAARLNYDLSQPQSSAYSSKHKPRTALQVSYHASTKTTSTALVHLGTSPSPRAREDNETTVDAIERSNVRPTKSKSVGLRAQAREGFWRRPPQRHGHGPGWENCGARCGRSKG